MPPPWQLLTVRASTNASTASSAQPDVSEVSTEWPTSGTLRKRAAGYCAAILRASSCGVRRSERPESTSTGTSGPAVGTPAGLGVGGQPVHSAGAENGATVSALNGANEVPLAPRYACHAPSRPATGE